MGIARAEVCTEPETQSSAGWLAALMDAKNGFVMRSTETRNGNEVISLAELKFQKTVPTAARKEYRKALIEDDRGHYSESFRLATSATLLCREFPDAHTALAVWYLRNLDVKNGARETQTALALDPYSLPARELWGLVQLSRADFSTAKKILEAVVTSDPSRRSAQYFLATTLSRSGESSKSAAHLEVASRLRLHPPKPVISEWLAFVPTD